MRIVFTYMLVSLLLITQAQEVDSCLKVIKKGYNILDDLTHPEGDEKVYFEYEQEVVNNEPGLERYTSRNSICLNAEKSVFKSSEGIEFYQDGLIQITLNELKKEIRIEKQQEKRKLLDQLGASKDQLFSSAEISTCEDVTNNGESYKKIVLIPSPDNQKKYTVDHLEYVVNTRTGLIKEITIVYRAGANISEMKVRYTKIDSNSNSDELETNFISLFLEKGRLREKYSTFKLTDLR